MYQNWLKKRFEKTPLKEITPLDLEDLKKEMAADNKAEATILHALSLVRQAFNKAVSWRLWKGENPCNSVKFPRPKNEKKPVPVAG